MRLVQFGDGTVAMYEGNLVIICSSYLDKIKLKKGKTMKKKETKRQKKVHKVMKEYKEGKLHSGSKKGPEVKSRKQAVAIALSEACKKSAKIPKKKGKSKTK